MEIIYIFSRMNRGYCSTFHEGRIVSEDMATFLLALSFGTVNHIVIIDPRCLVLYQFQVSPGPVVEVQLK